MGRLDSRTKKLSWDDTLAASSRRAEPSRATLVAAALHVPGSGCPSLHPCQVRVKPSYRELAGSHSPRTFLRRRAPGEPEHGEPANKKISGGSKNGGIGRSR